VTTVSIEEYQRHRREAGRASATVNREVESLRRAFNYAAKVTPPLFPRHLVPSIPLLPVDNVRTGYFDAAEVAALLKHVPDADVRDFIEWGFRTGMRKGEIAKLEWSMLDRSAPTWVLNLPGNITKNGRGRALGLQAEVRSIIERRLRARRFRLPADLPQVEQG
jgi:integrase